MTETTAPLSAPTAFQPADGAGYKRVLLKLSGEAFGGGKVGIDSGIVHSIAQQLADVVAGGTQVAVVVGHGGGELREVAREATEGALGVDLPVEHRVAVADQVDGDVEVLVRCGDELAAAVEDGLEVVTGSPERDPELGGHGAQVLWVDAPDRLVEVIEQHLDLTRGDEGDGQRNDHLAGAARGVPLADTR